MKNIIIYNTVDGNASVSLYAKNGNIWMNPMVKQATNKITI